MFNDVGSIFGRGFLLAVIAPAAFFCAAHVVAARAGVLPAELVAWWRGVAGGLETAFPASIAGVGLLLHTLAYGIIRSYEGYCRDVFFGAAGVLLVAGLLTGGHPRWIVLTYAGAVLVIGLMHLAGARLEARRYARGKTALENAEKAGDKALKLKLEHHFTRDFPAEVLLIRPTRFGNIIRAAEYHPRALYYMDPITMWTRLGAVISKTYTERLEDSNATTLTWLNGSVLLAVLAAEALAIAYVVREPFWFWTVAALIGAAYATYRLACDAARDWAEHIRGAFDLFRLDLLHQLGAEACRSQCITLKEERNLWVDVQRVIFYGRASHDTLGVRLRGSKREEKDGAGGGSEGGEPG